MRDKSIEKMIKKIEEEGRREAAKSADWQRKALENTIWVGPECLEGRTK